MQLAQQETRELGHPMTGTEHLLLGILLHESCAPSVILKSMGVTYRKAREEVLRIMGKSSPRDGDVEDFEFSMRAKALFRKALEDRQSDNNGHSEEQSDYDLDVVEPEGLIRAMVGMPRCTAQKVLHALDVDTDALLARLGARDILDDTLNILITTGPMADLHKMIQSDSFPVEPDYDDLHDDDEAHEILDAHDPMIGYIVDRKYEINSVIGRGGMGVVYKVRHLILDRPFAIKVIHPYLASDMKNRRRFQREAQAASRLTHPNLATVFDWDVMEDGRPYIVMYYIEGVKLSDLIRIRHTVPPVSWVSIFMQICEALSHAHNQGVLHRDLKPTNVILSKSGDAAHFVKVVDFGIAKFLKESSLEAKDLTETGEVFGSPLYMSPEQCLGRKLDVRSDIYSLGCVMYESLTGICPFYGDSLFETMTKHVKMPPNAFADVDPGNKTPKALEEIVMKALQKNPDLRFQSMKSLNRELALLLSQLK